MLQRVLFFVQWQSLEALQVAELGMTDVLRALR